MNKLFVRDILQSQAYLLIATLKTHKKRITIIIIIKLVGLLCIQRLFLHMIMATVIIYAYKRRLQQL